MFPLSFPYSILSRYAVIGDWVLDPFCGRGTTNYASRLLGLPSIGIDSNPVAVSIAQAKLANTSPKSIINTAKRILDEVSTPEDVPDGEFWDLAFHRKVLETICRLREGLLINCSSDSRKALRAVLMGALHGPRGKSSHSYLSNQSPRTYAPKPKYAIGYWKKHGLVPEFVDVLQIISSRATKYYSQENKIAVGDVVIADSRESRSFNKVKRKVKWVVTSPPYYGMGSYIPDQWLRLWLVGGQPKVDYSTKGQIGHLCPNTFADQLRQIWQNVGEVCLYNARLVIRMGSINYKKVNHIDILKKSFIGSGWKIQTVRSAGTASIGYRQSLHFSTTKNTALAEHDIWARWEG